MKKPIKWVALLLALTLLIPGFAAAWAEQAEDEDSWTVLVYMCGSDLESVGGMATVNLSEISRTSPMPNPTPYQPDFSVSTGGGTVNLLIQTGGCDNWRTEAELGFTIAADRLQRYRYVPELEQPFALEQEVALERMSDPSTLSDFIRWGAELCPARHYALVLWGHGGGSRTGLLPDERFDGQYMNLAELEQALAAGGVHFDDIVMDACMMANLETAQAVREHADWLVASEELAAGNGSAYDVWLNELYAHPSCDGYRLGRYICDSVQKKYADMGNEQASSTLTFSLIDTSKIDRVARAFEAFWMWMARAYDVQPRTFGLVCSLIGQSESYGAAADHMVDIGSMLIQPFSAAVIDNAVRGELADALMEAVPYMVKGSGRSEAHGLSFCFGPAMSPGELDVYAANCKNAAYLAMLAAVNDGWDAPDWVYQQVRPLTPIEDKEIYKLKLTVLDEDVGASPRLLVENALETVSSCNYLLFRRVGEDGELVKLGQNACGVTTREDERVVCTMNPVTTWPAINGEICDLELVNRTSTYYLCNIPMLVLDTRYDLRVAYKLDEAKTWSRRYWYLTEPRLTDISMAGAGESGSFEVYGFWKGYDDDSLNASRDTTSPALLKGQEYRLMYPIVMDDAGSGTYYELGERQQMPGVIDLEQMPLPPGEYAAAFLVWDIFGRQSETEMIFLNWDGETWTRAKGQGGIEALGDRH